jgi:hypothetical protein
MELGVRGRKSYVAVIEKISWLGAWVKTDSTDEKQTENSIVTPIFEELLLILLSIIIGVNNSAIAKPVVKSLETAVTKRNDPTITFLSTDTFPCCVRAIRLSWWNYTYISLAREIEEFC